MLRPRMGGGRRRGDAWHVVGLLLLLVLVGGGLVATEGADIRPVTVEVMEAEAGAANGPLLLRFDLPAQQLQAMPWAVWVPRIPRDAVWLEADGWSSTERDFFAPRRAEGVLPGGYVFLLPRAWEGPVELQLHARSAPDAHLQPRVMATVEVARCFDSIDQSRIFIVQ